METRYRFLSGRIIELKEALRNADDAYRTAKDGHAQAKASPDEVKQAYDTFFGLQQILEKVQAEFLTVQSAIFG